MPDHRLFTQQMSAQNPYAIVHTRLDDDEDSDICPVCDGDCTCHPAQNLPPPNTPSGPLSMLELSRICSVGPSTPSPSHTTTPTPKQPLKIKLTLAPPAKRSSPLPSLSTSKSRNQSETISDFVTDGYHRASSASSSSLTAHQPSPPTPLVHQPKKRGRPPKSSTTTATAATAPTAGPSHSYARKSLPPVSPLLKAAYKPLNPKSAAPGKHSTSYKRSSKSLNPSSKGTTASKTQTRIRHQNVKARAALGKKILSKNRRRRPTRESDQDDDDDDDQGGDEDDEDDDEYSGAYINNKSKKSKHAFPTFIPQSAIPSSLLSSNPSSSEDSSLTEFDSDSSIEAEEEQYIINSSLRHEKARAKRELLGGDDQSRGRKGKNNDWVIRPRKRSVGPSDVEMDVDSDATTDQDDDDDDDEDDDDGLGNGDPDGMGTNEEEGESVNEADVEAMGGITQEDEEDGEETDGPGPKRGYVGLATGWSEDDDESSFDADLFFANLSETDSLSSSSGSTGDDDATSTDTPTTAHQNSRRRRRYPRGPYARATRSLSDDQSDISSSFFISDFDDRTHVRRRTLDNLPFEITEGWDGQIVFTNGIEEGQGIVDIEFEEYREDEETEMESGFGGDEGDEGRETRVNDDDGDGIADGDVEMGGVDTAWAGIEGAEALFSSNGQDGVMENGDEGGYEEDEEQGGGDTTDEELIGSDHLPNERAMSLFCFPPPMTLHSINPLSTVSPSSSPCVDRKTRIDRLKRRLLHTPQNRHLLASARANGGVLPGTAVSTGGAHGKGGKAGVFCWDSGDEMDDEADDDLDDPWDSEDSFERHQRAARASAMEAASNGDKGRGLVTPSSSGAGGIDQRGRIESRRSRSLSSASVFPRGPRRGTFVHTPDTKRAIIGDEKKGVDVPSPHPRFSGRGRGRGRGGSLGHGVHGYSTGFGNHASMDNLGSFHEQEQHARAFSTVEQLLRQHLLEAFFATAGGPHGALVTVGGDLTTSAGGDDGSMQPGFTSCDDAVAETGAIELDDVLEASFFNDPEPPADDLPPAPPALAITTSSSSASSTSTSNGVTTNTSASSVVATPVDADGDEPMTPVDPSPSSVGLQVPPPTPISANVATSASASSIQADESTSSTIPSSSTSTSATTVSAASTSVKNLVNRWDVIPVGAFRQTREANWHARTLHTPGGSGNHRGSGGSADYGNAIRSSPLSVLWQSNAKGSVAAGKGAGGGNAKGKGKEKEKSKNKGKMNGEVASGSPSPMPIGSGSGMRRSGGGQDKAAKRRRIMMSSSTMSSPLILPISSSGSGGDKTPYGGSSAVTTPRAAQNLQQQQQQQQQKMPRKESRKERKLKKKSHGTGGGGQPGHNSAATTPMHQFHTHHHHPNSKTRGVSSTQRTNFFAASVPPLNL